MQLLVESQTNLYTYIKGWLIDTTESEWKTVNLVKKVLDVFVLTDITIDTRIFIDSYSKAFQDIIKHSDIPTKINEAKLRLPVVESIITAPTIQKLFAENLGNTLDLNAIAQTRFQYRKKASEVATDIDTSTLEQQNQLLGKRKQESQSSSSCRKRSQRLLEKNVQQQARKTKPLCNMTPEEILTEMFKTNKYLNLTKSIGKRYRPYMDTIRNHYNFDQDTFVTLEERRVLMEISFAKSNDQFKAIIQTLYMCNDLPENIEYIRAACQHLLDLWRSKRLNDHNNNEGWLRSNLYSMVWDRAFLFHDEFYVKRAECQSAVIKFLQLNDPDRELVQQKIDFILRNSNDESDYLSAEEKPATKSENHDLSKGRQLQVHMLELWQKWLGSPLLTSQLEAMTCQWSGSSLQVYGTKMLQNEKIVSYKKCNVTIPHTSNHYANVAYFLLIVLSVKRDVTLNYMKLTTMLSVINQHSISTLQIRSADQAYHNDSAPSSQSSNDNNDNNDNFIDYDPQYIKNAIEMCSNITHPDKLTNKSQWEEHIIDDYRNAQGTWI